MSDTPEDMTADEFDNWVSPLVPDSVVTAKVVPAMTNKPPKINLAELRALCAQDNNIKLRNRLVDHEAPALLDWIEAALPVLWWQSLAVGPTGQSTKEALAATALLARIEVK